MIDELLRRQEEPVKMLYSEEYYNDVTDKVKPVTKEVSNYIPDDPEIKEITEEFMNNDRSIVVDKMIAQMEENDSYFTIFPFTIKQGKIQSLKERIQDEQRKRTQQDSQVRQGVGDTEGEGRETDSDRSGERDERGNGAEEAGEGETEGPQRIVPLKDDIDKLNDLFAERPTPADKEPENQFRQELTGNYDKYNEESLDSFVYERGGDNAKELPHIYRSNLAKYSRVVLEPASEFSKKLFEDVVSCRGYSAW